MYCYKCGHQVSDNAAFCVKCGLKLVVDQAAPKAPHPMNSHGIMPQVKKKRYIYITVGAIVSTISIIILILAFQGYWGKKSPEITTVVVADGTTLSVGNRVYARAPGELRFLYTYWYRGYIVSIDNTDSVNVHWDSHLAINDLFAWGNEERSISIRDTLPAEKLYSNIP